jgi:hypothetical protein
MLSSTRREEEECGQRALWSIGISLFLGALLLVLARGRLCRIDFWRSEAGAGEVVGELFGVENGLDLTGGVQQRVGMCDVGADERADGAIELGETRDDYWWLAAAH